jgi:integrase
MPDAFAAVAMAWLRKFYPDDYENPETADAVAHKVTAHLIPFFAPRVDHISEITYSDCEDFVNYKAGQRSQSASSGAFVAEARDYTLADAAEWSSRSKSALRKAWLDKRLPNAYLDKSSGRQGIVKVPVGDLIKAGFTPGAKAAEVPCGYSRRNVGEMLSTLRRIFAFARAKGLMSQDPSEGIRARSPVKGARSIRSKSKKRLYLFDLALSKRIAQHLNIQHQVAYWLMRGVGLRISEAYGIDLHDIYRDEGYMIIRVWQQGGKKFKVRDDDGNTVKVEKKKKTKTKSSTRTIPIPKPVAELIELYIAAFHEESNPNTPLLKPKRGLGQAAFRAALKTANQLEQHGEAEVGFNATPHVQRAFFTTDLDECPRRARSNYLGHLVQDHEGGAVITETVYTLRRNGVRQLLVIADAMGALIENEIGTLLDPALAHQLIPTRLTRSVDERDHALEVLDSAGLIRIVDIDGESILDVPEAAEMLAISDRQVRRLVSKGVLDRRRFPGAGMTANSGVTLSSVDAHLCAHQDLTSRRDLLAEFGLSYRELDILISKLNIKPVESTTLGHRYAWAEVERLRQYFKDRAALSRRAVSIADTSSEIGCTRRTVDRFISLGQLRIDATATENLGLTMITRKSLDDLIQKRSKRATLPQVRPAGSIPILEAQQRAGLTRVQVLELKTHGVIVHRTPDYQFHVDEASLEEYLKGRT